MWAHALGTLPLVSQETCAAMEFYHQQLKLRLLNEKDQSVYQRADWLVNKLGTKVHSYFWLDEYSGKEDFARYWKNEWVSGPTALRKSLRIPDAHVVLEGKCAKIIGLKDQDTEHLVRNPGSEYAICDCSWAKMGNLCEHVFKIIKFCRDKGSVTPSMSMFHYSKALINMLHCAPFDSVVRDHAASLAIWVQMQLNAQISPESTLDEGNTTEKQTKGPSYICSDKVLETVNHGPGKRRRTEDFGNSPINQVTSDNLNGNRAQLEMNSAVDSSSTHIFVENGADSMDASLDTTSTDLLSTNAEFKNTVGSENLEKEHCSAMMEVEPQAIGCLPSADNSRANATLQAGSSTPLQ